MNHAKTDSRHWKDKLYKTSGNIYAVRMAYKGRRHRFELHPTVTLACKKAAKIYSMLLNDGWEKTLEHYKPDQKPNSVDPTFGEVFQAVQNVSTVKTSTLSDYINKCRTIITAIRGIDTDNSRYNKNSEGYKKWIQAVDETKLSAIKAPMVRDWRDKIIKSRAGGDPNSQEGHRAKISTNSTLRQARSLFGGGCLSKIKDRGIILPDPLPFHDTDEKKNPILSKVDHRRSQYRSVIDLPSLLMAGEKELSLDPDKRNQWLALMLGVLVGLDRIVMDRLLWEQVDTQAGTITIKSTKYFTSAKNASREDVMHLDPEMTALLQGYKARALSEGEIFVLKSENKIDLNRTDTFYRCNKDFKKLTKWLKEKGITDHKPIHALRKELASHVYETQGLDAASKILRHASTATTQRHYADPNKLKPISGLGHLLTQTNIEELPIKKNA